MEYKIIEKNSYQELEVKVNEYLQAGWELVGGIVCSRKINMLDKYIQAMIKKDK